MSLGLTIKNTIKKRHYKKKFSLLDLQPALISENFLNNVLISLESILL